MLVHKTNPGIIVKGICNVPEYTLERESWKELFRIHITNNAWTDLHKIWKKSPLLSKFRFVSNDQMKNRATYWIWYLVPFVKSWSFAVNTYWSLPKYLYRKGIIETREEGAMIPWYWFFIVKWNIM